MTPSELEAIREREAKATKGPWVLGRNFPNYLRGDRTRCVPTIETQAMKYGNSIIIEECHRPIGELHNFEFIAHARSDIPLLLTALDEAQKKNANLTTSLVDQQNELGRLPTPIFAAVGIASTHKMLLKLLVDQAINLTARITRLEAALQKIAKPALGGKIQQWIAQAALDGKDISATDKGEEENNK